MRWSILFWKDDISEDGGESSVLAAANVVVVVVVDLVVAVDIRAEEVWIPNGDSDDDSDGGGDDCMQKDSADGRFVINSIVKTHVANMYVYLILNWEVGRFDILIGSLELNLELNLELHLHWVWIVEIIILI